jgi:Xaa-Pro aminopeptidase
VALKPEYEERVARVRQVMRDQALAGVLLVGVFPEKEGHVAYLTGYRIWTPLWPSSDALTGAGFSFVLVTASEVELFATRLDPTSKCDLIRATECNNLLAAVGSRISDLLRSTPRMGVAGLDILPYPLSPRLPSAHNLVDLDSELFRWRAQKDDFERQILAEGAALAARAIEAGRSATRPTRLNRDIAAAVISAAIGLGAQHILRCRVRSGGETGVVRWPYASDRELLRGDFVQVDLVGIHKNYVFDVSRAWIVGTGDSNQLDAIGRAEQLTQSLVKCLRPDLSIAAAVDAWRLTNDLAPTYEAIVDGHSIGLDVVEPPWITLSEPFCLKEGMVFCVEPSVKFDGGQALKVEETVLIKKEENVILSVL